MSDFSCCDVALAAGLTEGPAAGVERRFQCPRHDDAKPSLSVNYRKDVWLCGPCGAGGTAWQLAAFIAELDPSDKRGVFAWLQVRGLTSGNGREPKSRIAANYRYVDEDGELLFEVVRFEPKDFRQRRPDGNGGWCWSLKGVRRVPYRLPELLDTDEVFVVEGEKDADALHALGFVATTVPGGAGKWRAEYVEHFADDQHVVVIPDNDDAGKKGAQDVATALFKKVASVKVLVLPDLPPKGDVSEFITACGDAELAAERLAIMAENAPEWEPNVGESPADDYHEGEAVSLEDFFAYMPMHRYLYTPCREMWPASSVNARLPRVSVAWSAKPVTATAYLDKERPVEQMTWAPGEQMLIHGKLIAEGGWINHPGASVFNLYRPPRTEPGDATQAGPWLDHMLKVYPDDADHIVAWLAHRVQRPQEKINHAIVLGGLQGIGKDTLLEPVKYAVGPWNVQEIVPTTLLGRFNTFVQSVILRINEARDLGDVNRYAFYEHLKLYTAAPPDVLRVDRKHTNEYSIPNIVGVVITTNHKTDGLFLPADDRRHYVAWSTLTKDDLPAAYFRALWSWYAQGGLLHAATCLAEYDLSFFDAKAPPPKTPAFHDIADANRAPEDSELADALDVLGNPDATTLDDIAMYSCADFREWLEDRRNSRNIPHRMESCGYVSVRNPDPKDGKWKIAGRRRVIYAKQELAPRDRIVAARALVESKS